MLIVFVPFLVKGQVESDATYEKIDVVPSNIKIGNSHKSVYLRLASDMTVSPSYKIPYNTGFTITASFANYGDEAFIGDFAIVVLDGDSIRFVQAYTSSSPGLPPYGQWSDINFTTAGIPALTIGTYEARLIYKLNGQSSWFYVDDYIYDNAAIEITCGTGKLDINIISIDTVIVQGGNLNMSFEYKNNTICPLNIMTYCYLEDDYSYRRIYSDTNIITLHPNNSHAAVCKIKNIDYAPSDEHRLVVVSYLIGSGITLWSGYRYIEVILEPDKYEPNNTMETSAELTVNFSNNTANVTTEGSNIHNVNDKDFYKVVLPAGYDYTIMSRVHDSKNSGDGKTYTCDVEFATCTVGTFWSQKFDVQADNITGFKGGTLSFQVTPKAYQTGGTYLLELAITRTANGEQSVNEFSKGNEVKICPNPVADFAEISFGEASQIDQIYLFDMLGKLLKIIPVTNRNMQIDMRDIPSGVYVLQLKTTNFTTGHQKIVKQ